MPLPTRVCSDRGLMDYNVIKHPDGFPDAFINVDPWHFQQLFMKTLDKRSSVWKDVHRKFSQCLYTHLPNANGQLELSLEEPDKIVEKVNDLIKAYRSHACGYPVITNATEFW